jgi:hypothetical protein
MLGHVYNWKREGDTGGCSSVFSHSYHHKIWDTLQHGIFPCNTHEAINTDNLHIKIKYSCEFT